jgi:hypothetical protein
MPELRACPSLMNRCGIGTTPWDGNTRRREIAAQMVRSTLRETCGSAVRFIQGCARALTGKGPLELDSGGKDRPFRMPPSLFNKVCLVGHW